MGAATRRGSILARRALRRRGLARETSETRSPAVLNARPPSPTATERLLPVRLAHAGQMRRVARPG